MVDALLTGMGWVFVVVAGMVITVFMLMEGFTGLGVNMLLVAVGPLCVAFAAHEKTEAYFVIDPSRRHSSNSTTASFTPATREQRPRSRGSCAAGSSTRTPGLHSTWKIA